MKSEKEYIWLVGVILLIVGVLLLFSFIDVSQPYIKEENKLKTFQSYSELQNFLKDNSELGRGFGFFEKRTAVASVGIPPKESAGGDFSGEAAQYSRTNIQVEGVDEADIVKNDGKYIYSIVGNKVVIVNAFPANEIKVLSEISINKSVIEIFVNENKLVIFSEGYEPVILSGNNADGESVVNSVKTNVDTKIAVGDYFPGRYSPPRTYVYIYDISDRENPLLEKDISFDGSYLDSRMIKDYVYIISAKYIEGNDPILPVYKINGQENRVLASDIYYFDYFDYSYVFNSIGAINLKNGEFSSKVYLTGATNNIYVSKDNIYLTYTKNINNKDYWEKFIKEVLIPVLPESEREKVSVILDYNKPLDEKLNDANKVVENYSNSLAGNEKAEFDQRLYEELGKFEIRIRKENEKTAIHKINVYKNDIKYETAGEVYGSVLNQFSMDEYDGYFRIATTSGEAFDGSSSNNLYVLDKDLEVVGKIEDLAQGEKIYSARFIGDRVYLVTFKKIDPFFVIDLSNVEKPEVLGYLKIPGYSDYLHPYDENHIIGIGKEAVDAGDEGFGRDFAWYQGLKISIFDVREVASPKETAKVVIGDRGTDSFALQDHKAFLFDKERNLLVIPVNLAQIDKSRYGEEIPDSAYGDIVWQGAYVFDINLEEIKIRGKISHFDMIKKYGPASEEPINAKREDSQGNIWTKIDKDKWKMINGELVSDEHAKPSGIRDYKSVIWEDAIIDEQPGGINYKFNFYDYGSQIQRSLYIDDVLYTISQKKIKANDLDNLSEISKVNLPYSQNYGEIVIY